MQATAIIVWIYGALVLAGGVIGWVKARSKPPLISGVVFAFGLALSGIAVWQGTRAGLYLAEALAVSLLLAFLLRLAKTRMFMPAGSWPSLASWWRDSLVWRFVDE